MTATVFVSYRRDDTSGYTGRLAADLGVTSDRIRYS
jgi:hypothetical protein